MYIRNKPTMKCRECGEQATPHSSGVCTSCLFENHAHPTVEPMFPFAQKGGR